MCSGHNSHIQLVVVIARFTTASPYVSAKTILKRRNRYEVLPQPCMQATNCNHVGQGHSCTQVDSLSASSSPRCVNHIVTASPAFIHAVISFHCESWMFSQTIELKHTMSTMLPPPAGGRQNRGTAFLAVALVFTIIAFCFVLTRVYVRLWLKRAFGWDDGMAILAMVRLRISNVVHGRSS